MKRSFPKISLCLLLLAFVQMAAAYDFKVGGIYYSIFPANSEDDYRVSVVSQLYERTSTGFKYIVSYSGDVEIPSTVTFRGNTYRVTAIGEYAFYDCKSLKSVSIPGSVVSIYRNAFAGCNRLERVTLTEGLKYIYTEAFRSSSKLKNIDFPSTLVSISESAFEFSGLQSLTIPDNVTSLGKEAFSRCDSLRTIHIGSGVKKLDNGQFVRCASLKHVTIPANVSATYRTFAYCSELETVVMSEGIKTVGENTFYKCTRLSSVTIPTTVQTIGYGAFDHCDSLQTIVLPESVKNISHEAFRGCGLTEIHALRATPPTLMDNTFEDVDKDACTLFVPLGCADAYRSDTYWGAFLRIIEEDSELAAKKMEISTLYAEISHLCSQYEAFLQRNDAALCAALTDVQQENTAIAGSLLSEATTLRADIENSGLSTRLADSLHAVLKDVREVVALQNDSNHQCRLARAIRLFQAMHAHCKGLYESYVIELNNHDTAMSEAETLSDYAAIWSLLHQDYEDFKNSITLLGEFAETVKRFSHQFADIQATLSAQSARLEELALSLPQIVQSDIAAKMLTATRLLEQNRGLYAELHALCYGEAYTAYDAGWRLLRENEWQFDNLQAKAERAKKVLDSLTVAEAQRDSLHAVLKTIIEEGREAIDMQYKDWKNMDYYDQIRNFTVLHLDGFTLHIDSCAAVLDTVSTMRDINHLCDALSANGEALRLHVDDLEMAYNQFRGISYVHEASTTLEQLHKQLDDLMQRLETFETGIKTLTTPRRHRVFTLQGLPVKQHAAKRLPRGVYIIDGKTVIVK